MKMSLCNTFRLFAVSLAIALSLIDAPVNSFTISRSGQITKTIHVNNQEERQFLDVKNDLRKPNSTNLSNEDGLIVTTELYSENIIETIQDQSTDTSLYTNSLELMTKAAETTDNINEAKISNYEEQNNLFGQNKYTHVSQNLATSEAKQLSSWKKYSIINRKQNLVPFDSNTTEATKFDETGIPHQDSKSNDITSLNQIKNFLFPSGFFKSEVQNDTITSSEVTDKPMRDNLDTTNETSTTDKGVPATVESKRGGFLDFSLKSLFDDKKDTSQENNSSHTKGRRLSWRFGSRYRGKEDSSAEKEKERSRFRLRNNKDRKTGNNNNNNTKESKEDRSKEIESRENSDKKGFPFKGHNDAEKTNMKSKYSDGNDNQYKKDGKNRENTLHTKHEKSRLDAKNDKEILAEWNEYERIREKTETEHFKESREDKDVNTLDQKKNSNHFSRSQNYNANSREEFRKEYIANPKEQSTTDINIWKSSANENSQLSYINSKEISKERNKGRQRIHESNNKERDENSFHLGSNDGEAFSDENSYKNKKHEKSENKIKEQTNKQDSIYYDDRSLSRLSNDNSRERNNEQNDKNKKYNRSRIENDRQKGNEEITINNNDKTSDEMREGIYKNNKILSSSYEKTTTSVEHKTDAKLNSQQNFEISNDREKSSFENSKATIKQNQTLEINEGNNKQNVNDLQKPMTIEYIKQYLSTIDEEEENDTKIPSVEEETTTIKQTIAAVEYHSQLNNINTTSKTLEPYNIPNLLISLPSPRNRDEIQEYSRSNKIDNMQEKLNTEKEDIQGLYKVDDTTPIIDVKQIPDIVQRKTEINLEVPGDLKENSTTNERQNYKTENKIVKETKTVIQMNEDNRKEELMKEEVISNYEENFERYKEVYKTTTEAINSIKIYELNKKSEVKQNNTVDEKLIVKPLSFLEKLKTTILYPVGVNYKPPKKIEVQSPKPFLRDPDDNSWRNESLSSLGIVFKPKNSSKPFTQVLKNKTETEWNNLIEKPNKNEMPDLRERLEKITEIRKTKKKKTDVFGNVIYNDYEETYSRETTFPKDTESPTSTSTLPTTVSPKLSTSTIATTTDAGQYNISVMKTTTEKSKKIFNVAEYYDTSDEDDADYLTLAKIDLKKFSVPIKNNNPYVTPSTWPVTSMRFEDQRYHDKKPTLQYFPPLTTPKIVFKDYENDFHQKMGTFTDTEPPTNVLPVSYPKLTTSVPKVGRQQLFTPNFRSFTKSMEYATRVPDLPEDKNGYTFVTDDGSFNRAADVIKHYRDFLNAVAKDHDEDKHVEEYSPFTKIPTQVVTMSDAIIDHNINSKPEVGENYDYENSFRKDVLQRFVHNFNQDTERFKSDLPLLYNNSVIHGGRGPGGDVASSRAYLSRMLTRPSGECDNSTAELSPAYELQYYVPEQEEKEEVDLKPVTLAYQYGYEN